MAELQVWLVPFRSAVRVGIITVIAVGQNARVMNVVENDSFACQRGFIGLSRKGFFFVLRKS